MGMNQTPASERVHVSFFGKRNAGKSSIINAVTGQDLAIVSSVMGTTTDPVYKTMELLPLGPVMVIDTPGIDDEGELGALRIRKSYQVLNKTDIAILVIDSTAGKGEEELELIHRFHKKGIPYLIVYNKIDLLSTEKIKDLAMSVRAGEVLVSASDGMNIQELKEKIARLLKLVGLEEVADIPVERYSKGMKQRLQIARGLINDPEYIFLDEPTLGLDIVIAKEIRKVIHELAKKDDKGILLTTHYISEAEELCDYIYILDNGKIIAQGTKEELKELFNCKPKVVLQEPGLEEILMKIISDSRGDGNEKKSVSN